MRVREGAKVEHGAGHNAFLRSGRISIKKDEEGQNARAEKDSFESLSILHESLSISQRCTSSRYPFLSIQ